MSEKIKFDFKKVIDYWKEGAENNYQTAKFLYKGKRYSDCLFFCHLMLEKILKGLVVANIKTHAPHTHKLVDLAKRAEIKLTKNQIDYLTEITEFNIAGRYDNIKQEFYKKCAKKYTEKYFKICEELYLWLRKKLCL
ncbi:HEPN domain-containing protein [Patescibacteria group bacterium]|nr:HEPN domain-containing protein [Patescibacteria group bacterium]